MSKAKHIDITMLNRELVNVNDLPIEVKELISDDFSEVEVVQYPMSDMDNLILSPLLDWDMGDENIQRSTVNLETVVSIGVFNGPSCDVFKKADDSENAWIIYTCMDELVVVKI